MSTDIHIEKSWKDILSNEFEKTYFQKLQAFLASERQKHLVYPPAGNVFAAFEHTPFSRVKVIILGQDPYHRPGQAQGLSFSVPEKMPIPPSLLNIFKELQQELNLEIPKNGNLMSWAEQGVFLLNATLTVRAGDAGSHQKKGWEIFTNAVISNLSEYRSNLIFLLWGNFARSKKELIDTGKHYILEAPHPSPFSARQGFFGCNHFKQTNEILQQQGQKPINWQIE